MIIRVAAVLAALVAVAACGGSSQGAQGANLSSMAIQPADLPAGMVRCDLSGDIASFLDREKSADPATYDTVKSDWDAVRANGATGAYAGLYTDSSAHCAAFRSSSANPGAAPYRLAVNFVIQFKDEAAAAGTYATGTFFGYSVADLKSGGVPVLQGAATGLTPNSIIRSADLISQTIFVALWQNKTYLVTLTVLNVDAAAAQKAAVSENKRIK